MLSNLLYLMFYLINLSNLTISGFLYFFIWNICFVPTTFFFESHKRIPVQIIGEMIDILLLC